MLGLQDASIWLVGGAFLAAAVAIGFAGFRLSYVADTLADRTGMNVDLPEISQPECDAERRLGPKARERLRQLLAGVY